MAAHATAKASYSVKEIANKFPQSLIGRAYVFAQKAHQGQNRRSGEAYFIHALKTAENLAHWRLDESSIAAGLLHDIVEDTPVTEAELKKTFGDEIAFLVRGVTKLGRVKYRGAEGKVENLRKMILALSQDLRVIFVKLADRLHNMQTLSALPPQKQKRIALETDEIYAPIAHRLGMQELAGELHDLAFSYLHPQELRWIEANVADEYAARRKYLERIEPEFERILEGAGITPLVVDFRAKHHYSLYRKLLRYDMDISRIYDLVALRAILPTVADCYAALGAIHAVWPPLPGRIKDYIAMPKANNYRSLHTTVIGPENKYIEIQIRTKEMHEENEYGIAAHWFYKEHRAEGIRKIGANKQIADAKQWINQIKAWQEEHAATENPEDFLRAMKVEFFKDRVFAITPKGDVIDLPAGSTPVDFAYRIHSEIGNTASGAKVNGKLAPLNQELQSGDLVEIITQKNKRPSEDWLAFVKSSVARDHIKSAIRKKKLTVAGKRAPARVEFRIVVEDRVGLLKDITAIIARSHVSIENLRIIENPGGRFPIDKIICAIADKEKIERLVLKLKRVKGIREVSYQLM
jgi:GTP pyrophosphokinase